MPAAYLSDNSNVLKANHVVKTTNLARKMNLSYGNQRRSEIRWLLDIIRRRKLPADAVARRTVYVCKFFHGWVEMWWELLIEWKCCIVTA